MWIRFILIASAINGLTACASRILQGWGLNEGYRLEFLSLWFGSGAAVALVVMLASGMRLGRVEIALGLAMGTCSLAGEVFLLRALQGLPGNIAYSGVIAGEISAVGVIGAVAFRERLGPKGMLGIAAGVAAVVLLTVS
jgi:multidrug transporter EmrE-like cation transporter